jgi:hypothetical protein
MFLGYWCVQSECSSEVCAKTLPVLPLQMQTNRGHLERVRWLIEGSCICRLACHTLRLSTMRCPQSKRCYALPVSIIFFAVYITALEGAAQPHAEPQIHQWAWG